MAAAVHLSGSVIYSTWTVNSICTLKYPQFFQGRGFIRERGKAPGQMNGREEGWDYALNINPFTPKISLLILLNDCHNSYDFSSENLLLDQLIIPWLIFLFILITFLHDIVWKLWGEILSWSLMGVKGSNPCRGIEKWNNVLDPCFKLTSSQFERDGITLKAFGNFPDRYLAKICPTL